MTTLRSPDAVIALAASVREWANVFIQSALARRGVHDILPAHGAVFHVLFQGPMQMGALARAIRRKKNTVTGLINTLEERGYCVRTPDPDDARAQLIALTPKALEVRAMMDEISRELLRTVWDGADEAEQAACIATLAKILDNLTNAETGTQPKERSS